MTLKEFAKSELQRAGWFDDDGAYDGMMGDAVMRLIEVFADQGHSGFSAGMTVKLFQKLANYEPLLPLTGDDDEWRESIGGAYQNTRCSRVFKDTSGAYDVEGKIFRDPDGSCFTSRDSRVYITFPYIPKTEYVDVAADGQEETK